MTARDWNGTTDYVQFASPTNPSGLAYSFATWVDLDATTRGYFLSIGASVGAEGLNFLFYITTANSLAVFHTPGRQQVDSGLSTGKHHVGFSYDGGSLGTGVHIYLDGAEVTYTSTTDGTNADMPGLWLVGNRITGSRCVNGRMWWPAFWLAEHSADTFAALAAGYHPACFEQGLVWCPDLSSLKDPYSGITGTASGTTIQDSLGPQIMPCGPMVWTAAPEAGATWHSRLSRNSRLLQGKL